MAANESSDEEFIFYENQLCASLALYISLFVFVVSSLVALIQDQTKRKNKCNYVPFFLAIG